MTEVGVKSSPCCENPQILEQPGESVQSQWKDQKMREFKLTVDKLDEEICKYKQQVGELSNNDDQLPRAAYFRIQRDKWEAEEKLDEVIQAKQRVEEKAEIEDIVHE